ncbi:MAG: YebC/PmpR family DNA-binding transcriptional regulator [Patescibacteria group bacterium]
MSGHSKWSTIKRQKGAADNKRGNLFTKLARVITLAVQESGKDPEMNFRLRIALDQARQANMPKDTIERAIQRGAGEDNDAPIHPVLYEGFSPGGIAILIAGATDNPNRAVADVRHAVTKSGGRLGEQGSVQWMFEQVGFIRISAVEGTERDALELAVIDAGAEDIQEEDGTLDIITNPDKLSAVLAVLKKQHIEPRSAEITFLPSNPTEADDAAREKLEKLTDTLLDLDDVQQVYAAA